MAFWLDALGAPMSFTRFLSSRARDVLYDLLVHICWADGRITPDELSAARGAADALAMDTTSLGGLFGRVAVSLDAIGLDQLGPLERPLAYAAAVWMAMADQELAVSEHAVLRRTRRALDLSEELAERIELLGIQHAREGGAVAATSVEGSQQRQRSLETLLDQVSVAMLA